MCFLPYFICSSQLQGGVDGFLTQRVGWNPYFSKPFNDWKVDCVESFFVFCVGRERVGMRNIECFGLRQKVASFL